MIIVVVGENPPEICDLIFTANKAKYVRFNFSQAKSAVHKVLGNLRVATEKKYRPFQSIVKSIEASEKVVLVDDCTSAERVKAMRQSGAKFVHVATSQWYEDGDLYWEKRPKTLKDITAFLADLEKYVYHDGKILYQGEGWVLTNH